MSAANMAVYLSKTEVAERLGMKSVRSLNKVPLPEPDARIGGTVGWLPATIDAWHAERPGRGWWGGR
ncbi:helix-turn-helix DNA-binding protein [Mycobacterium phage KayaCho]|uniref:DNA binding protein n=1 Tax=Mycobacterium phage KayaCho TaxID=1340830 RepID=UPI000387ECAC|nr:DNA binding protein [Mycobacterium phage KayaCho]AGT12941.1 helix-turn-helix DNA-binding protein [Mycobacterium phage KayaCho]